MLWVVMKLKLWKFWNDFIYLYEKYNAKIENYTIKNKSQLRNTAFFGVAPRLKPKTGQLTF